MRGQVRLRAWDTGAFCLCLYFPAALSLPLAYTSPPPHSPLPAHMLMSWTPEECKGQGEPLDDRHPLCARLVEKPSRGSEEHPKSGLGPIVTRTASGPALAFWQAVLAGDEGCVSRILADSSTGLAPDSVFDTSDPERWRDFRFNIRALSTGRGPGGSQRERGEDSDGALGSLFLPLPTSPHQLEGFCLPWDLRPTSPLPRTVVSDIRRGADHPTACGGQSWPHRSPAAAAEAASKARQCPWGPHRPARGLCCRPHCLCSCAAGGRSRPQHR